MKKSAFSPWAAASVSQLLNGLTPPTLKASESPDHVNSTLLDEFAAGAVRKVPVSLTSASFLNWYQYCVPGCRPVTSILTVQSRAAVGLNLPLKAFGPLRDEFVQPSTLICSGVVSPATRVQRIARDCVTSPLATPSGYVTAPNAADGDMSAATASAASAGIHNFFTLCPPSVETDHAPDAAPQKTRPNAATLRYAPT